MAVTEKGIIDRLYIIAGLMFVFAVSIGAKLVMIQTVEGEKYRKIAAERTFKDFIIEPNRGNLYSDDGSLLATSVTHYDIRFDAVTVSPTTFEKFIKPLCDSLALFSDKTPSYYEQALRKARKHNNRYFLLARGVGYARYKRMKRFPLLRLGANRGGLIVEQRTVREHPLGDIARRSVGYERIDEQGYVTRVGLEGAFSNFLKGRAGKRSKQKIARGQWKPINDNNEIEPEDGKDVISTININIQDIAHHALLAQLEKYKADHGCVVVMETNTGEIKAISNLGRNSKGAYYERLNYAIGESHEPGSTFKLMAMVAALEDKVIDTSYVVDTKRGVFKIYDSYVRDSNGRGYGKITASKAFEVSSNTGVVRIIDRFYRANPKKFVNRLYNMELHKKLDMAIIGEGEPKIPHPNNKKQWSGISLQWMAYGYGVSLTPLQTLTFYNAIANGGEMVKPRLIKEVTEWGETVRRFDKEIINPSICSKQTVAKVTQMLKNVVEKRHGTGRRLYSRNFSMAGKTGTCQKDYASGEDNLSYISSFAGFFPVENPKYSCIVVIHEPNKNLGYYGADVAGPVFKKIAHKIYTNSPVISEVQKINTSAKKTEKSYLSYNKKAQKNYKYVPDVRGMAGMDALALLENLGMRVIVKGTGRVATQSVLRGTPIVKNRLIILELT